MQSRTPSGQSREEAVVHQHTADGGHRSSVASLELAFDSSAPSHARAFAWGVLASWGTAEAARETVGLVLSELVGNAIRHASPPVRVKVVDEHRYVVVEVCDGSGAAPLLRSPTARDMTGRGLAIVEGLTLRWGWRPHGNGKCVWCDVAVTGAGPS
jgi:anti-sigma regulatory factor (Ser/Thr protein kinase)